MRTIIDLPEDQLAGLAELCAHDQISRAEAIRQAIAAMLAQRTKQAVDRDFDAAFGLWKDRGIDTDTYLAEIRAEWDR